MSDKLKINFYRKTRSGRQKRSVLLIVQCDAMNQNQVQDFRERMNKSENRVDIAMIPKDSKVTVVYL